MKAIYWVVGLVIVVGLSVGVLVSPIDTPIDIAKPDPAAQEGDDSESESVAESDLTREAEVGIKENHFDPRLEWECIEASRGSSGLERTYECQSFFMGQQFAEEVVWGVVFREDGEVESTEALGQPGGPQRQFP